MGDRNKIECLHCNKTGLVDSGAPSPQGFFIEIACHSCLGYGTLVLNSMLKGTVCGMRLFETKEGPLVALDEFDNLIVAECDESTLRKLLCQWYCD